MTGKKKKAYMILVGNPFVKCSPGRPRGRWKGSIAQVAREVYIGVLDWTRIISNSWLCFFNGSESSGYFTRQLVMLFVC
jgi:hypothetical protein